MILVESPLDVVRLESIGITGGVASFGSLVSNDQVQLLKSAERLIIAMDNDDAGNLSASNLLQALLQCNKEAWFFDYSDTDMKDVGGMSRQEVINGIVSSIHSVRYSLWDMV
jgi:DNA primase